MNWTAVMLERLAVERRIARLALRSDEADRHLRMLANYLHRRMERLPAAERAAPEGGDPAAGPDYIDDLMKPDLGGSD